MLKKTFQKELDKLALLNVKYKEQLEKVEDAIKKEFGNYPCEIDNDYFIDTYCVGSQNMTVKKLNETMIK